MKCPTGQIVKYKLKNKKKYWYEKDKYQEPRKKHLIHKIAYNLQND